MKTRIRKSIQRFIERNILADDPSSEPSGLDRQDVHRLFDLRSAAWACPAPSGGAVLPVRVGTFSAPKK